MLRLLINTTLTAQGVSDKAVNLSNAKLDYVGFTLS
jgi:hypothetical protein